MQVVEETAANYLVETDNGKIENIGKSNQNKLLIDHNLWGILKDGDEIFVATCDDGTTVTVAPRGDDAREYILTVGDYHPIHLGPHQKSDLVDALMKGKEDGAMAERLRNLFDSVREDQVRVGVMEPLGNQPPFDSRVEVQSGGWFIHGHLLLTWEGDFRHPNTESAERSGSVVEPTANQDAYQVNIGSPTGSENRDVTVDGEKYRLTDSEVEFLAHALWAIQNTPEEV